MHTPISLPLARTALLLIDLQEEHRHDQRYLVGNYDQVLARCAGLLDMARAQNLGVVHAAFVRDFSRVPPRPFEPVQDDGSPAFSAPGSNLTDICPEVAPAKDEVVFPKNNLSCFSEADFLEHLHQRPEWLVICGVWSEACVSATVRDAIEHGIRVLLVKDACGSATDAMHQSAILTLANRLYGGAICDTQTAVALMQGQERPAWRPTGPVPLRFDATTMAAVYDTL